jgi:hypothetical protein
MGLTKKVNADFEAKEKAGGEVKVESEECEDEEVTIELKEEANKEAEEEDEEEARG